MRSFPAVALRHTLPKPRYISSGITFGDGGDGLGETPHGLLDETSRVLQARVTQEAVQDLPALDAQLGGWDEAVTKVMEARKFEQHQKFLKSHGCDY